MCVLEVGGGGVGVGSVSPTDSDWQCRNFSGGFLDKVNVKVLAISPID